MSLRGSDYECPLRPRIRNAKRTDLDRTCGPQNDSLAAVSGSRYQFGAPAAPHSLPAFPTPPGKAVQPGSHEHFHTASSSRPGPFFLGPAYADDEHQPLLINGNTTHPDLACPLPTALRFTPPSTGEHIRCTRVVFDSSRLWDLGSSRWYSRAAHAHSRQNFLRRPPSPRSLARVA